MNKKALLGIGLVTIVILAAIVWFGRPITGGTTVPDDQNTSESTLKAQELSFDFGTISMAKGKVTHAYTVTNTGTEPVTVKKVYTSCMCTTASFVSNGKTYGPFGMPGHTAIPSIDVSLAPGATAQIEAVFDPAAHGPAGIGQISRVVILENSAGKPVEIAFTANVTP